MLGGLCCHGAELWVHPLLPPSVCTPFGLSTMFTVTGKLLVKPRVSCPLCDPSWGLCVPSAVGLPGL